LTSSGTSLRLETRGRKTGLPHIVELRFVSSGGSYFVFPGRKSSDWYLNAVSSGSAKIRIGEFLIDTAVKPVEGAERAEAMAAFSRKYGKRFVENWYGSSTRCLSLSPRGPTLKRGVVKGELGASTSVEEWVAMKRNYYEDVASAFDSASEEYDFTISRNFINTWIRKRSIHVLLRYASPEDTLLEIGCGTGVEALEISKYVTGIVATDISPSMIELLSLKVRAKHLEGKVVPYVLGATEISKARDFIGGKRIRIAYSFNGALNCEPRIKSFVSELHSLLDASGYFICSIRNTICLSEMVSHALALQFDKTTPRKRQPIMVSVGGRDIPSTYLSPSIFVGFFEPHFVLREMIALPALLPPAYLNDYYLKIRSRMPLLERLDQLLSGKFLFNRLGDQTLFVLQKV
jgi:deazaflavin-dependent oxidoreductase (nitroreductase family)